MKWLLMATSIICGALGQLFMKAGMQSVGGGTGGVLPRVAIRLSEH